MLSMSDIDEFSSVFIRECYLIWFKSFCLAVEQRPHGRFALSSTPGCGKTFATNLIFKMVANSKIPHVKSILYHFGTTFYYLHEDKVFSITQELAGMIAIQPGIFYIVDGHDANPVHSKCLTLFIASPRNPNFKHWYYHAQIKPSYFPVWSLDELLQCRALCYQTIKEETVVARFQKYGGVARYVFWQQGDPPSLENVVMDNDTRKSIRYVGEVSQLLSSSHMLLHIAVDDQMHFKHIVLASHHVSILLFSKYYQESLENLKSLLGSGGALAGHLFECYVHFLFEHGHSDPLLCRSLEGDDTEFYLELEQRNMVVFDSLPANLSSSNYYVPLSTKFPAIDAITKKVALQYTVSETHPIKGVQGIETLARLYAGNTLPLLFVVPELIADKFHKQQILTTHGQIPVKMPSVRQFVAGLPLGIDTSIVKRRRLE